jgi:hypothetical protein
VTVATDVDVQEILRYGLWVEKFRCETSYYFLPGKFKFYVLLFILESCPLFCMRVKLSLLH